MRAEAVELREDRLLLLLLLLLALLLPPAEVGWTAVLDALREVSM